MKLPPSPTRNELLSRASRLRKLMRSRGIDMFLMADHFNAIYFTGFSCSNSVTLIGLKKAIFLTDFRYIEDARATIGTFDVRLMTQNGANEIRQAMREMAPERIGFESNLPYGRFRTLRGTLGGSWLCAGDLPGQVRAEKSDSEIAIIAANQRVNERVLAATLQNVRLGMTELDIRRIVRNEMVRRDVEESFETIVATGPNSSRPHAVPGARRLRRGDLLLIDVGVKAAAYHSDMTRTLIAGQGSDAQRRIYDIVLEAQRRALKRIGPGVACRDVDAAAREYIASQGHAEHFGHGLGHGVGLEIHEGPALNPRSAAVLQLGMVVTVEPGIYVPGFGGVRIEDLVVVTENGHRNLTKAEKGLLTAIPAA